MGFGARDDLQGVVRAAERGVCGTEALAGAGGDGGENSRTGFAGAARAGSGAGRALRY